MATTKGWRTAEIRAAAPDWQLFRDGCPAASRWSRSARAPIGWWSRVRALDAGVLLFSSSGHFLRVLAARWLGLEVSAGRYFLLGTASFSALSYEHDLSEPVVRFWNDTRHVGAE